MIYVTGDTHIPIDIKKLNKRCFPEQSNLTKNDYVIICGDFGAIWNNSNTDKYWQAWLEDRNFTTLFIDGNHENFDLLSQYPISEWNGGKVQFIDKSIIHLMRGQVYNIEGLKFFTMGGAASIDKYRRVEGVSWWAGELPSQEEFDEAMNNIEKNNYNVDYVLTHTTSKNNMELMGSIKENIQLNSFFDLLEKELKYKHWYFGHFHIDETFNKKHTCLYDKVVKIC